MKIISSEYSNEPIEVLYSLRESLLVVIQAIVLTQMGKENTHLRYYNTELKMVNDAINYKIQSVLE